MHGSSVYTKKYHYVAVFLILSSTFSSKESLWSREVKHSFRLGVHMYTLSCAKGEVKVEVVGDVC